jgi:uncharacterized protein
MQLTEWQWTLLALGALLTGMSKTGVAGVSVLGVALFANAMPARTSTGALLPLLLCADLFGIAFFRKHAVWSHLWRLFPWVMAGILLGYVALDRVSNSQMQRIIGGILVAMVLMHLWRERQSDSLVARLPHSVWFAATMGVLAGFTTMVANAAGPIMGLYLLAIGLPKLEFVGTGAWFFLLVNAIKVPFSAQLGLITVDSLWLDAKLVAPMLPGALLGPIILRRINQRAFVWMILGLALVVALRLLW